MCLPVGVKNLCLSSRQKIFVDKLGKCMLFHEGSDFVTERLRKSENLGPKTIKVSNQNVPNFKSECYFLLPINLQAVLRDAGEDIAVTWYLLL